MKNEIIVLGLGNPLMSDEGIGGFLINELLKQKTDYTGIDIIDAGTGGMALLSLIEGRKKVIIIDCAYMDQKPGTIKRFTPEDVTSVKKLAHLSLHEVDILKVLEIARDFSQCPKDVVIFGIEPEKIELGNQLSATLLKSIDHYLSAVSSELSL